MTHTIKFRATQCDDRTDKIMKVMCGADMIGVAVIITIETEEEPTREYLDEMAKTIENLPKYEHRYFRDVRVC